MLFVDRSGLRQAALALGLILAIPWSFNQLPLESLRMVLATALLCFGVMPWVIRLAEYYKVMDYPGGRRTHRQQTPRLGGLAIIFSTNITLFLNFNYSLELKAVCISALCVAMVSLLDDIHEVSARTKLLVQALACLSMMLLGVHIELVPGTGWQGGIIEYVVTLMWMIGITNAFNFLDGINGLAAALAATVCLLMALMAVLTNQTYMLLLSLAVVGASLGFLPDNARYRRPARIFLGDSGSTYLGWMMAGIAVMGDWSSEGPIKAFSAPVLIFSVMIFDMIYTTIARIRRGDVRSLWEWVDYTGRDHLHHRLLALGYLPVEAVGAAVTLCVVTGLGALALVTDSRYVMWMLLGQATALYLAVSAVMIQAARLKSNGE